jgi:hypothetical protein
MLLQDPLYIYCLQAQHKNRVAKRVAKNTCDKISIVARCIKVKTLLLHFILRKLNLIISLSISK